MSPMIVNPFRFGGAGSQFRSAIGVFTAPTVLSATVDIVVPFEAKFIRLHGNRITVAVGNHTETTDGKYGEGWATGTTSRRCIAGQADHNADPTATDSGDRDDACFHTLGIDGSTTGRLDVNSWTWNGTQTTIQLIADQAFGQAIRLFYEVWGDTGDASFSAAISTHTEPGATGNHGETVGISDADAFLFMGAGQTAAIPSTSAHSKLFTGACDAAGGSYVWCGASEDGVATSDTGRYSRSGQCIAMQPGDPNTVDWRESFVSRSGTTLTLNCLERASTRRYFIAAFKGCSAQAGGVTFASDGVAASISTAFRPTAGIFVSPINPENADDTPASALALSMGHYGNNQVGANLEGCWAVWELDNQGAAVCQAGIRNLDAIIIDVTSTVEFDCDTISDTGLSLRADDPISRAVFIGYLLLG